MTGELNLLRAILPQLAQNPSVLTGPGDDCAVVAERADSDLLAAVDQVIAGVHFTTDTLPEVAGAKLMNRNLSDVAAMGGVPRWALLTLAAGGEYGDDWLLRFAQGAAAAGAKFDVPVVGGDTASLAGEGFAATLTILGEVPHRMAVLRSGAKAGQALFVTGAIGNSFLNGHHLDFTPRLREGAWLRGRAGAMLDVSDGLLLDARRLAESSHIDLWIDTAAIPLAPGASAPGAWSDGEDYELLFSAPEEILAEYPAELTPIRRIGQVHPGNGVLRDITGKALNQEHSGYEHH